MLTGNLSYVSPRKRAQRTFELINLGISGDLPWKAHGEGAEKGLECGAKIQVTEDVREWDYGDYEGITSPEIRKIRAQQGIQGTWDIWRDGCPGGEYVTAALLRVPFPPFLMLCVLLTFFAYKEPGAGHRASRPPD